MGLPPGGVPPGGNGGENGGNGNPLPPTPPANASVSMNSSDYQRINDLVASLSDRMASVAGSVSDMTRMLTEAFRPLEKLNKEAESLNENVKDTVNQYDDVKDSLKALLEFQKRSANVQGQNVKTFRDLNKEVEDLRENAQALTRKGFMSPEAQRGYQQLLIGTSRITDNFRREMSKLKVQMDTSLDPDVVVRLRKQVQDLNRDVNNAIDSTRKYGVIKGAFSKAGVSVYDIPMIGRQVGSYMGHKERFEGFAKASKDLKGAQAAQRASRVEAYQVAKAVAGAGENRGDYGKMANEIAKGAGGGGWLDRLIGTKVLKAGGDEGMLAKIVGAGGGSFTRGFGGIMGDLGESGVAKIAPFAEGLAAPLAILDSIKELFDTMVERNKKFESALAGGGVFSTTKGAFAPASNALTPTALGALMSTGAYSGEKNLKIAQAMAQGGLSIADLAKTPQPGAGQYAAGVMGGFQRAVYGAGRVAGFGEEETVRTTIKLLQQYRQSMTSSEDFFITVDKSAKAAGLSAVKYVSVLDEITAGFGRLNKSFNESVNLLKLVGESGETTAEDMKDFAENLTGKPQQLTTPLSAFLLSQTTPQRRKQMEAEQEEATHARVEQVAQAAEKVGKPIDKKLLEGFTNISDLQTYLEENVYRGLSPEQKQTIAPTAQELAQSIQLRQAYRGYAGMIPGQAPTRPLAFAEQMEQLTGPGGNALFKTQMMNSTFKLLSQKLGTDITEAMAKGTLTGDQTTRINETLKALGVTNPQATQTRMLATVQGIAPSTLTAITNKTLNPQQVAVMWRLLSKNPQIRADMAKYGAPTGAPGTPEYLRSQGEILKKFADESEKNRDNIRETIYKNMDSQSDDSDNLLEAFTASTEAQPSDQERRDTMSTAEKMAADTRSTSDYMKDIRDAILNNLVPAVDAIADFIAHPATSFATRMFGIDWNKSANQMGAGAPGEGVYSWEKAILSGKSEQERKDRLNTALQAFGATQDTTNNNQWILPDTMVPSLRNAVLSMLKDPALTATNTGLGGPLATVSTDKQGKTIINITNNNVDATTKGTPNTGVLPTNVPNETTTPRPLTPKVNTSTTTGVNQ